jgi:hypothetical protein
MHILVQAWRLIPRGFSTVNRSSKGEAAPGRGPGAAGACGIRSAGYRGSGSVVVYLPTGSSACLTRNFRMPLTRFWARAVRAGAARTLARSFALETARDSFAAGV